MSVSPTTGMSRLSLEGVSPPNTAVQDQMQPVRATPSPHESGRDSDESDWDEDEDTSHVVSSPTGLKYNITKLSPQSQMVVRELFNQPSVNTPPQISLELCGIKEEESEDEGVFYAFQMHEVVPCSVRIGSRQSSRFSKPRCECPDARYRHERPCKHLVWLFDRISKEALFDHDPESELTLTEYGYAQELGDPFQQISEIRLDVLADSLHCDIAGPNCDTAPPSRARVREAREIVAAVAGIDPREVQHYRTDLETSYSNTTLIRRGDLEATLFSLLLASHSLAAWVRDELRPFDLAVDPFRELQQRVLRVISDLDAYSFSLQDESIIEAGPSRGKEVEGPRNVSWAAAQIRHCVGRIERLVSRGINPLTAWERASAARALVGILKAVVHHNIESHGGNTLNDRNLFMLLVGNQDTGFVFSALDMLVDQSQFIEELEDIMEMLGRFGTPASYAANMRGLITRMRSHKGGRGTSASGSISSSAEGPSGGGIRRSRTPLLEESAVAQPPVGSDSGVAFVSGGPSSSNTGQFLTPELPASASRRGARGRASAAGRAGRGRGSASTTGSKRSVSGSGQDRGRGPKRAR